MYRSGHDGTFFFHFLCFPFDPFLCFVLLIRFSTRYAQAYSLAYFGFPFHVPFCCDLLAGVYFACEILRLELYSFTILSLGKGGICLRILFARSSKFFVLHLYLHCLPPYFAIVVWVLVMLKVVSIYLICCLHINPLATAAVVHQAKKNLDVYM